MIMASNQDTVFGLADTPTLSDRVRDYLLEELTSGRLRPGDRINEAELARTLGISRNPIREAIFGLAQRGFLISNPRRGHSMRIFALDDVDDLFSFRICIESFAIRQALPLMSVADHGRLGAIVANMLAAAKADRVSVVRECDVMLHRTICELSRNRQTLQAHTAIDTEMQMLIASVDLAQESLLESAMAHFPIVEALASRDVSRSVSVMEQHLEATWVRVRTVYEQAARQASPQMSPKLAEWTDAAPRVERLPLARRQ